MLWKLLKYDFRSMGKSFALIWPAALVLALVNHFTLPYDSREAEVSGVLELVLLMAFVSVLFAMFVAVMIFVVQRFYKGLLGDEGYLMHTLPVRAWQLVLSKLICAVVTSAVSMAVMFAACILMVPIRWSQVLRIAFFRDLWEGLTSHPDAVAYLLEFLLVCTLALILFITMTYLSMAIGHLFRRRILMSVAAFILLDILGTVYMDFLDSLNVLANVLSTNTHAAFLGASAVMLPLVLLFTWGTVWILGHRLNLE